MLVGSKLPAFVSLLVLGVSIAGCARYDNTGSESNVKLVHQADAEKVDVLIDGEHFTSYLYTDDIAALKKPVIYPIKTANGHAITRGFPLEEKAGERSDHPHHIGFWLNYGDVNGFDFWNNSNAIKPERQPKMGSIFHKEILSAAGNTLKVSAVWKSADGRELLDEVTTFTFFGDSSSRTIDRVSTLTAREDVLFKDNKEGMVAIRVTRALEHPADKPMRLTDAAGKATDVAVLDNTGVTGLYTNEAGVTGVDVWATRSPWMMLSGVVEGESVVVSILDHPGNPGYPTYWHARGYGLFSANPLGQNVFSKGAEELNFSLKKGESRDFRYRVLVKSGEMNASDMQRAHAAFVQAN